MYFDPDNLYAPDQGGDKLNFFRLDEGKTLRILRAMRMVLDDDLLPENAKSWKRNPFSVIATDDSMWSYYCRAYLSINGNSKRAMPSLSDFFRSLAICQFFVMNALNGPEADGARQMLRKHWYAWGKLSLQPVAKRLDIGLMANGEPDSEKLYSLMSVTFAGWNEFQSLEYRDIWVEDNTTKLVVFQETLPAPYDTIIVCCEKDAAYEGITLSAKAMGALAVYSGGGKSARAGIEKLYYGALDKKVREGRRVIVLVISDYDEDGYSVIAPTFARQLATYVPEDQIDYIRVGINPDQVERFGHDWSDKWYAIKWSVGTSLANNYLMFGRDKAINEYRCQSCNHPTINLGTVCPVCGCPQLPLETPSTMGEKKPFKEFFELHSPRGFELDALPRIDYCELLVEGLAQIVDWRDLCRVLSEAQKPDTWMATSNVRDVINERNISIRDLNDYRDRLQRWFDKRMEELENRRNKINSITWAAASALVARHKDDDAIFDNDPECSPEEMAEHMKQARFYMGRCTWCYTEIDKCRDPKRHKASGYHEEAPEGERLNRVSFYQPFDSSIRTTNLTAITLDKEKDPISKIFRHSFKFPQVDIQIDEEE